ncbi:MAG: hypothetical protein AB1742_03100 [bacterium]
MVIRVCFEGGKHKDIRAPINDSYRRAFRKLFEKPDYIERMDWIPCGGSSNVDNIFRKYVISRNERGMSSDDEEILMLKDSDGHDLARLRDDVVRNLPSEIRDQISRENDIHFMVQEIEAWFIANKYPEKTNPEGIRRPSEWLEDLPGGGYRKEYAPCWLRHINKDTVSEKCPAFKRFRERLGELGVN